jgi:hypothetical protein
MVADAGVALDHIERIVPLGGRLSDVPPNARGGTVRAIGCSRPFPLHPLLDECKNLFCKEKGLAERVAGGQPGEVYPNERD